jgi:hypothetical protein
LEFVTALLGFGVTWEIYRQTLLPYDGVRRMARIVFFLIFTVVVVNALYEFSGSPLASLAPTTLELERTLRAIQALLLLVVVGLVVYYSIPLGRNVRSMLTGYGLMVGSGVITFTLASVFSHVDWTWVAVPLQLEYCVTLVIWCVGMWSYAPNPNLEMALERDYERISAHTAKAFGRLRDHLLESWWQ